MTVIIANDTPPAIRGILKRWFIEPKPNVFVGTLNRRTREKVIEYATRNAENMSLLIIHSDTNCQGFVIEHRGNPDRNHTQKSGLWLVAEKWIDPENQPF
jgi:CRISPR-associated protein Cas2